MYDRKRTNFSSFEITLKADVRNICVTEEGKKKQIQIDQDRIDSENKSLTLHRLMNRLNCRDVHR